jgi:phage/plasmid-associated DNA primase
MDTNRKPTIRDADDRATFNRLYPVPFTVQIADDRIDKDLPTKLLAEAEGILAFGVDGARQWAESGLGRPPEISEAREQWHAESDQIGRFIDERCVIGEACRIAAGALYAAYKRWAEDSGEYPLSASCSVKKSGIAVWKNAIQTGAKSIMGSV